MLSLRGGKRDFYSTAFFAVVLPGTRVQAGVLFAGMPGRIVRELTDTDRGLFSQTPQRYAARAAQHRGARWGDNPAG